MLPISVVAGPGDLVPEESFTPCCCQGFDLTFFVLCIGAASPIPSGSHARYAEKLLIPVSFRQGISSALNPSVLAISSPMAELINSGIPPRGSAFAMSSTRVPVHGYVGGVAARSRPFLGNEVPP